MKKKIFTHSVLNNTEREIQIIVEYIHFVEVIPPNKTFRIEVLTFKNANPLNDLRLEYDSDGLAIYFDNKIEDYGSYEICFFLDKIRICSQTI
ncbi:hypothetical protein ACX0G7_16495 [Flavitalea antarctica]